MCGQVTDESMIFDKKKKGIFARGYGEEEENAVEVPRHGVVDEAETVAVAAEAKSQAI